MTKLKALWANATFRDVVLAGLAAAVGAASIYFKTPQAMVAYLAIRAAVAAWVAKNQ